MALRGYFAIGILAIQLFATSAFAQKHIVEVTSQIPSLPSGQLATVKGAGFVVADCGQPVCSENEYPDIPSSLKWRYFVITASHVGAGLSPKIVIPGSRFSILGQWNDFSNDITIFEISPPGVLPFAFYFHSRTHYALIAPLIGAGSMHMFTLERMMTSIIDDNILNIGQGSHARLILPHWLREIPRGYSGGPYLQVATSASKLVRGLHVANFVARAQSLPSMSGSPALYLESKNQIDGVPKFSSLTPYDRSAPPAIIKRPEEEYRGTAFVIFGMVTRALNVSGPDGKVKANEALSFFTGNAAITKVLNSAIQRQGSEQGYWNLWRGYYCYNTNEQATCFFREGPVGNGMIVEGYKGPDRILDEQSRSTFNKTIEQLNAGVPYELNKLPNTGVLKEITGSLRKQNPALQFLKVQ